MRQNRLEWDRLIDMKRTIRRAREDDREVLGALKLRSSLAWGEHVEQLMALPEAGHFPTKHVPYAIVAECDDTLVGFITVVPGSSFEAEIEDLFVAPEVWRTGVGKSLLSEAEASAKASGIRSLSVVAGKRAQPFYEAVGFHFVGTSETEFSLAVELRKSLT